VEQEGIILILDADPISYERILQDPARNTTDASIRALKRGGVT